MSITEPMQMNLIDDIVDMMIIHISTITVSYGILDNFLNMILRLNLHKSLDAQNLQK